MAVGDEALEGADRDRLALAAAAAVLLAGVVADAADARRQRAQVHDLLERGEEPPLADVGHVVHAGQVRRAGLLAGRPRLGLPAGGVERGDHPDQRQRADGHPAPGVRLHLQRACSSATPIATTSEVEQPARRVRRPGVAEPGKHAARAPTPTRRRGRSSAARMQPLAQIEPADAAPAAPGAPLVGDGAVVALGVPRRGRRPGRAAGRGRRGARRPGLPRLRLHGCGMIRPSAGARSRTRAARSRCRRTLQRRC